MSDAIEKYYRQANISPYLLRQKMSKLQQHMDIKQEFEYWITHRQYKVVDPVAVEGYTAQKLACLSKYLDGEGAFMLLIELRENPGKARKRISSGFIQK